jgi:hypothetical protein
MSSRQAGLTHDSQSHTQVTQNMPRKDTNVRWMDRIPADILRLLGLYHNDVYFKVSLFSMRSYRALLEIRGLIIRSPLTVLDAATYMDRNSKAVEFYDKGVFCQPKNSGCLSTSHVTYFSKREKFKDVVYSPPTAFRLYRQRGCPREVAFEQAMLSYDQIETDIDKAGRSRFPMRFWVSGEYFDRPTRAAVITSIHELPD